MGQKTHPIGFRVGISRKWFASWYGDQKVKASFDTRTSKQFFNFKGSIVSRGGSFVSEIQDFFDKLIYHMSFINSFFARRTLLVDFRIFKVSGGLTYVFFIYVNIGANN